jgi:uncharacterized protein (DUF983 family)
MAGTTMVEIQCPHCEEDVELEDGVFGLFDCPHCDEEFDWRRDEDSSTALKQLFVGFFSPIGFLILAMIFHESYDSVIYLCGLSFISAIFMIIKGYLAGDKWTWKPLLYVLLLTPLLLIVYAVAYMIIVQPFVSGV